jgi:hypothetical protein
MGMLRVANTPGRILEGILDGILDGILGGTCVNILEYVLGRFEDLAKLVKHVKREDLVWPLAKHVELVEHEIHKEPEEPEELAVHEALAVHESHEEHANIHVV